VTLRIADIQQRWAEVEKALEAEDDIVLTRYGKPVARLMRYSEATCESEPIRKRPRFDPEKYLAKMNKIFGGKRLRSSDKRLSQSRADRNFRG
jgi:antitoxin (DNA-binding transcriptional repressor) of toxin-antitoxin stability system